MLSWGWLAEAKVLCILCHRGVQLVLAYSWARPAILVVGKGRGGKFLFLLFLHFHSFSFLPCPSLSSPLLSLFSISLGDNTKWLTRIGLSLNPNTIKILLYFSQKVVKRGLGIIHSTYFQWESSKSFIAVTRKTRKKNVPHLLTAYIRLNI